MIQIDMDIPNDCEHCPFHDYEQGYCFASGKPSPMYYGYCEWALNTNDDKFTEKKTKRHPKCPLKEEKHGKWNIEISHDGYQATYRCSECGHQFKWIYNPHFPLVFNYCQKCGARMEDGKID